MNRLEEVLKELKISQSEFAEMQNVGRQYINKICKNKQQPSLKTLNRWANDLNIDVRRLLETNKKEMKDCIEKPEK